MVMSIEAWFLHNLVADVMFEWRCISHMTTQSYWTKDDSDRTYGETKSFTARKLANCVQFQLKKERFVDAVSVDNFIAEQDTEM